LKTPAGFESCIEDIKAVLDFGLPVKQDILYLLKATVDWLGGYPSLKVKSFQANFTS